MRKYTGFRVKQRANSPIEFIVLTASAKEVASWSRADDIRIDAGNVQRELVESRWKQVVKFFKASENNIIPTSVTIAFDGETVKQVAAADLSETTPNFSIEDLDGGVDGLVQIQFSDAVRDHAYIIDGQHRLKGMSEAAEALTLPVCLFPALSRLERAFQFVTINNKSHKVPTDNLKALLRNFENIEEGLRKRLSAASITVRGFATHVDIMNEDPDGPFYKLVDWVNNRHADAKMTIAPAAIENAIKAIHKGFPETAKDPGDAVLVLSAIWKAIFAHYGVTPATVENFPNLTKKATIQRVTEMVIEHLVKMLDPAFSIGGVTKGEAQEASMAAKNLITNIPAEFWQEEWKMKGLDTGAGRDVIAQSIRSLKSQVDKHQDDSTFDWRTTNVLFRDATLPAGLDDDT